MMEAKNLPPPLPPRLDWFVHTQAGQLAQGGVPTWFHGAISRRAAEKLLEPQPPGSFLIRVSNSHVGYTLSYKADGCCRHFMVKLLNDGSIVMPGEDAVHASLEDLVTFYQQKPLRPYGEVLTQPCGQEDPANVDYEDLFFYSNALAEEFTSLSCDPSEPQGLSSCLTVAPEQASLDPVLLHWPKGRKPSGETERSTENTASSCYTKAPLKSVRQKLWKSLKILPQTGKRVQQQLKSHLAATSLPLLSDTSSGAGTSGHEDACAVNHTDAFEGSQAPHGPLQGRNAHWREILRTVSWSGISSEDRDLHRAVVRSLSQQVSMQEPQDWLPEEYRQPPPFAPGYC